MPWCDDCDRHFVNSFALQQHLNTAAVHRPVYMCEPCKLSFSSERALLQHENSSMKHLHRIYTYVCEQCRWGSNYESTFHKHEIEVHFWCKTHNIYFQNENNLRQHLSSKAHGQTNKCPFCGWLFPTISAVAGHMESGRCEGGMNRLKVDRTIHARDRSGIVTNQKLIGYGNWEEPDVWATDEAWNGDGYECYFCDNEYDTLGKLNVHITRHHTQRPRHNLYRCFGEGCGKQFNQFSHLLSHLEHSRTCRAGGKKGLLSNGSRLLLN